MQVDKALLDFYNHFFNQQKEFTLVEPFVDDQEKGIIGLIKSNTSKTDLFMEVTIPGNYPYQELLIYTKSIKGYDHLIYKGEEQGSWFCLNTPFVEGIEERLKLELRRLVEWIEKFLNQGQKDAHYDYIISERNLPSIMFFSESSEDYSTGRFNEKQFGEFTLYNILEKERFSIEIADQLGNNLQSFSEAYLKRKSKKAYWIFLEKEPVSINSTLYTEWERFVKEQNIPDEFLKVLEEDFRKINEIYQKEGISNMSFNTDSEIFDSLKLKIDVSFEIKIAFGYLIQKESDKPEVHWELASINYKAGKILNQIEWAQTKNISRNRFFGRGGFCEEIAKSKILIIGVGAIGSSLAETLVRGGISDLSIMDNDQIEAGNICRGNFDFTSVSKFKVEELSSKLTKISPFVKIDHVYFNLMCVGIFNSKIYEELKGFLEKYDLIFDCTASNEVLHFLANLEISKKIISLSITDKSTKLLCLSNFGKSNLYDLRKLALYSFGETEPANFYEGAGCYYPTFQAAYFDINALLHYALKNINLKAWKKEKQSSFYLAYEDDKITYNEYEEFYQPELKFSLTINKKSIEKIVHHSKIYFPSEYGGVLMGGYSADGKSIYVTDILVPEKFRNSSVFFQSDNEKINKEIKRIHDASYGSLIYLGDWHSHPNMSNQYSGVDFISIAQQAASENVSINNPLMAIISIDKTGYEIGYYIYYDHKLYQFREINKKEELSENGKKNID